MQKSGYAGAREMSKEIEHLYGFQKTAPDHLDSGNWQTVMDVYVKDKYHLGLSRFFESENPHARQTLLARLLEVDRQRIHQFSPADRALLAREYAQTVVRDSAACNAQVCGNAVLRRYLIRQLRIIGSVEAAARVDLAFRRSLESRPSAPTRSPKRPADTLADLRKLSFSMITWAQQVPVVWRLKAIPWWVWLLLASVYTAVTLMPARARRNTGVQALEIGRKAQ